MVSTCERNFPVDDRLRAAGWRIKSRPRSGIDVWELRDGRGRVLMVATTEEARQFVAKAKTKYAEFAK